MSWFKVDDSFYDHPKVFDAPDCAMALWIRAGCWSARNRTDGFVPAGMPARLCDDQERAVRELLDRGLWRRAKGGYQFHDWSDFQPLRSDTDRIASEKASGAILGNHLRWHVKKKINNPDCEFCQGKQASDSDRITDRISDGGTDPSANPPDPTRPEESSTNSLRGEPDGFAEFWATYPPRKNSSKADARTAYAAALKKGADPADILAGAKVYAADRHGQDPQYTAHARTWLHGQRWEDALATPAPRERAKFAWEN